VGGVLILTYVIVRDPFPSNLRLSVVVLNEDIKVKPFNELGAVCYGVESR
jgi:hypothetical protein